MFNINKYNGEKIKTFILNLISAFMLSSAITIFFSKESFNSIAYVENVHIPILLFIFFLIFIVEFILEELFRLKGKSAFFGCFISAFIYVLCCGGDFYFTLTCCVFLLIFTCYIMKEGLLDIGFCPRTKETDRIVFSVFLIIALLTGYACVIRYLSYRSSNFDLGIFAQMFENMTKTGIAATTVERNRYLSHFGVHFSPILYSLLPLYFLFRTPACLVFIQPFIILSGVFPFKRILRLKNINENNVFMYAIVFLLYPAFVAPCYYDFHENIFFTPLLLWFLYFFEKGKNAPAVVFLILIFGVKEEAGLYVASIGMYFIFGKKKTGSGAALIFTSLIHFFITTSLIKHIGGETLSATHYYNFITGDNSGMLSIIKSVMLSPGYTVAQLLNSEKTVYIIYVFLPVLFLPFKNRNFSVYFLLLPFVLMNLITAYCYQFDICYQYGFGSGASIMYMCCESLSAGKSKHKGGVLCVMMCLLLCVNVVFPKFSANINSYTVNKEEIALSDEIINCIPNGASVSATTFLLPKLYKFSELYMLDNSGDIFTDYALIDLRYEDEYFFDEAMLKQKGYRVICEKGFIRLYSIK